MVLLNNTNKELDFLRDKVRSVTTEIMKAAQQRIELARRIGEVKSRFGIDIRDEKVEEEVRLRVISLAEEIGMSSEFALQLLNLLLTESEQVQREKTLQKIV
jgi:chorismate mutase